MNAEDLKVGHVYSAKKPARTGTLFSPVWNDRQVMWIDSLGIQLQYDGPTVRNGVHYPRVDVAKFLAWAKEDITETMPEDGTWRPAP